MIRRQLIPLLAQVAVRLVLAGAIAALVAFVGLRLSAPQFTPQEPSCYWGFAAPGTLPPSSLVLNSQVVCGGPQAARPVAVQRGLALPVLLVHAAGVTLAPLFLALLLATGIGVPLGAWSAARPRSRLAGLLLTVSATGIALPGFLVSFAIVYAELALVTHTGHRIIAFTDYHFDPLHLAMPTLALACAPTALLAQATAATFGTIYDQDYIRAARGRGIERVRLLAGHVLPVAAGPLLAAIAAGAQLTLTTIPLLEYLFNWPGLGLLLLQALEGQDWRALAATMATFAVAFTAVGVLADQAGTRARPRRLEQGR